MIKIIERVEDTINTYMDEGVPEARIDEDTLYIGHTLDETRANSLKTLAFLYSQYGGYERPLDEYKEKMGKNVNYLQIPEEMLRDYAIMDAIVTRICWENMMKHMRELDSKYPNDFGTDTLEDYYYTRRIPNANTYAIMEYNGCYVNKDKLNKLREDMTKAIQDVKSKLSESLGVSKDFKWESGKELGILLEKRGWEDLGRTKSGEYACGDFQISRWKKTHPEAKLIEKLKSYSTIYNITVGDNTRNSLLAEFFDNNDEEGEKGWTQYLHYHNEDDSWRMHSVYKPMMADSGRSKCTQPNLQQIPSRGEFSHEVKECICTPDDDKFYMVTCDYSSLQCRLASIDCCDKDDPLFLLLKQGKGVDLHSSTSYTSFFENKEVDIDIITVEQDGKTFTFLGGESVVTKERGEIFACELTEEDTLVI